MCFRPAEIKPNNCPKCGKINKPIAKVCEECGEPLEMVKSDFDADQASLDSHVAAVPGAPGAPKAPGAPSAPKAPGVPGAPSVPKAPGAPGAPSAS